MSVIQVVLAWVGSPVRDRADLATENLALRQRVAVLREKAKRPRLRQRDRIFGRSCRESGATGAPPCSLYSSIP